MLKREFERAMAACAAWCGIASSLRSSPWILWKSRELWRVTLLSRRSGSRCDKSLLRRNTLSRRSVSCRCAISEAERDGAVGISGGSSVRVPKQLSRSSA